MSSFIHLGRSKKTRDGTHDNELVLVPDGTCLTWNPILLGTRAGIKSMYLKVRDRACVARRRVVSIFVASPRLQHPIVLPSRLPSASPPKSPAPVSGRHIGPSSVASAFDAVALQHPS
jgi:hypothetical protein